MKLQISTRIAIFAVVELAAAGRNHQLSVADIGEKFEISNHHLAKVMNVLGRAGLVRSTRGAGGGYQFIGNAKRTTLLEVVQLFEDMSSERGPTTADTTPEGRALGAIVAEIDDIARATLGSITIATMQKLIERHANGERRRAKTVKPNGRAVTLSG